MAAEPDLRRDRLQRPDGPGLHPRSPKAGHQRSGGDQCGGLRHSYETGLVAPALTTVEAPLYALGSSAVTNLLTFAPGRTVPVGTAAGPANAPHSPGIDVRFRPVFRHRLESWMIDPQRGCVLCHIELSVCTVCNGWSQHYKTCNAVCRSSWSRPAPWPAAPRERCSRS